MNNHRNWKVCFIFLNLSVPTVPLLIYSQLVMTFPLCASQSNHHCFSTSTLARQMLSDAIRWIWCSTNFIRKAPGFDHISSPHLSRPAGVKGHPLMSFRVESWGEAGGGFLWQRWKVYRNHINIAHKHINQHTWLLCPVLSSLRSYRWAWLDAPFCPC